MTTPDSSANPFEDLVVAMAAVNNFSIEKSHALREGYGDAGLFDVDVVASSSQETIFECLRQAGYPRSDFVTGLVAERLRGAAEELRHGKLETLRKAVENRNRETVSELLLPIPGVGPTVLRNFEYLAGVIQ